MNAQDPSSEGVVGAISSILKRVRFLNFTTSSDEDEGAEDAYTSHRKTTSSKTCPFSVDRKHTSSSSHKYSSTSENLSPFSNSSSLYQEDFPIQSSRPTSIPKRLWMNQSSSSHSLTSSGSSGCFTNDSLPSSDSFHSLRCDEEFSEPDDEDVNATSSFLEKDAIPGDGDEDLPIYTLAEVNMHDQPHDLWMVFFDKVYDLTDFYLEHPGGEELLLEHAGRDGTMAYRGVGHSKDASLQLATFLIGRLPDHECIFRGWDLE